MPSTLLNDEACMALAYEIAEHSHCLKQKVGALIVREGLVIAKAYNAFPKPPHDCLSLSQGGGGCPRSLRGGCLYAIHAEQYAILDGLKRGLVLDDTTLYVTLSPCLPCARLILGSGIPRLVYSHSYAILKGLPKEEGVDFLAKFGVEVVHLKSLVAQSQDFRDVVA